MEPMSSNEKTKNSSLSKRRGSIVKSINKLASSFVSDEAGTAASASLASMMPMFMMNADAAATVAAPATAGAVSAGDVEARVGYVVEGG